MLLRTWVESSPQDAIRVEDVIPSISQKQAITEKLEKVCRKVSNRVPDTQIPNVDRKHAAVLQRKRELEEKRRLDIESKYLEKEMRKKEEVMRKQMQQAE